MNRLTNHNRGVSKPTDARTVIITDLDGTLLDKLTYSCVTAMPLVLRLQKQGIPIIFCSSKTWVEQEVYRRMLGIEDPFIVENGGAIFINQGYFPFPYDYHRAVRNYDVIELGAPYEEVRRKIKEISEKNNVPVEGFGDMDAIAIANLTGLDVKSAELAKKREYVETLNLEGMEQEIRFILSKIEEAGLKWSKGTRFYSIGGRSDKGQATKIVAKLLEKKLGKIKTIGIGDSSGDESMLSEVGVPVLVQKPGGYWEDIGIKNLYRAGGVGPQGWVRAVEELTGV